jgi:manganese oxidase
MRRTPIAIVSILASLTLVAAGCGGDDEETTASTPATTETAAEAAATEVAMTEYAFDPSDLTVKSGDSVDVVNDGEIPHNYTVEDTDVATEDLDAGQNEELPIDLDPGDYTVICTIAGHAEQGMTGNLTVEE